MEISPDKPTEIEIYSASVLYGKERVLENISLSIREKRVGFIGRNGSGKTTLLRILAGLQELKNGKVLIDGTEVAKERKTAIKKVGIIFQNPDHQIIFPTVGEELRFGLTQLGLNRNDADLKVIESRLRPLLFVFTCGSPYVGSPIMLKSSSVDWLFHATHF